MPARTKPELLAQVPLFSACTHKELALVAKLADREAIRSGSVLVAEGEAGRDFFVIAEGDAAVTLRGDHIASLGPGDFFGEMSLLDLGPRAATVKAETDMVVYAIDRSDFNRLLDEVPFVGRKIL